jgi:hypothetical protein
MKSPPSVTCRVIKLIPDFGAGAMAVHSGGWILAFELKQSGESTMHERKTTGQRLALEESRDSCWALLGKYFHLNRREQEFAYMTRLAKSNRRSRAYIAAILLGSVGMQVVPPAHAKPLKDTITPPQVTLPRQALMGREDQPTIHLYNPHFDWLTSGAIYETETRAQEIVEHEFVHGIDRYVQAHRHHW